MTTMRPFVRLLCVGSCGALLAACGDDGGDSNGSASTGLTGGLSFTSDGPTGDPTGDASGDSPTGNEGTIGMTGDSTPTTGDTTMINLTAADTETSTDPSPSTSETTDSSDPSETTETTDPTAPPAVCGDGVLEPGEACDDGNTLDGDTCSADCQSVLVPQVCGDGAVQAPEACDDGNDVPADGCEPDCTLTPAVCGDGVAEQGEECDDGNTQNPGPDDTCNPDCTLAPACAAPGQYVVCDAGLNLADKADKTNAHKAMGICNDTPANSVQISNFQFDSPIDMAWQVARGFGSYMFDHDMDPGTPNQLLYSPREGESFLIISTGRVNAPNPQGIVTHGPNSQGGNGDNGNPDSPETLPAPLSNLVGSNNGAGGTPFLQCDGVRDCSDTLAGQWILGNSNPNDKLFFKFNTTVPASTYGYTFDFVFCSAEWPVYVNTGFNDLLIAWQTDPTPDDPNQDPPVDAYTGNVTFIPNPNNPAQGLPLTITALNPYFLGPGFASNEPQLAGTGFENNACTDWFTARGGVRPGANLEIGFFIADMSDSILATMAILDNFRWDCQGCVPSEIDSCGVIPQ
jgi:cysteine-rich repeat protein